MSHVFNRGSAPLFALVIVLIVVAVASSHKPGHAAGEIGIVYISVQGFGPAARAWYDGAAAAGVPLQRALDEWGRKGYSVSKMSEFRIPVAERKQDDPDVWTILLESK